MPPVTYIVPDELTSPKFGNAFARGCGGKVQFADKLLEGDVALFGSPKRWKLLQQARAEGRTWYYADHGYFGYNVFRITKNGYQHDGRGEATPDRFDTHHLKIKRWKRDGGHVLICPQSPGFLELHGLESERWLDDLKTTLAGVTDREIRIRRKTERFTRPIVEDLRGCWAVVVHSSACAIDALLYGVPVFVLAPWAAAARMGLSDLTQIESPIYPDDREQFFWNLAAHQFKWVEITHGDAWRMVQ